MKENFAKLNIWEEELRAKMEKDSLLSFSENDNVSLRMLNHNYEEIFNNLVEGKTIRIKELDLTSQTISKALSEAEFEANQTKKIEIYLSRNDLNQRKFLSSLINKDNVYLTFGLIDYFEDSKVKIISAPLVFLNINVEYIKEENFFQIKNKNHELRLNYHLIEHLEKTKRLDLSYPIENNFSLSEYLTFVNIKIKNHHYSVNNGCFVSLFNFDSYLNYKNFMNSKDKISSLPIFKSVSYYNAEFFNLNKVNPLRLDNKYLSLLNLDNEEYKIFKRINLRENLVLKTNNFQNKIHLLSNICYDFLLNNKNILITYNDDKSYQEITTFLNDSALSSFALDLNFKTINKEKTLMRYSNQEKLEYDVKLLNTKVIDETLETYYLMKNNFKKMINALRISNEPLKLSINSSINEYFTLHNYPLIDFEIPNINLLTEANLNTYLKNINEFVTALERLNCNYKDHPFYGFDSLTLTQKDYQKIREIYILLSDELVNTFKLIDELHNLIATPHADTLKEFKCLLNILSLTKKVRNIREEFFNIPSRDKIIQRLQKHNDLFYSHSSQRAKIISLYEKNVFIIDIKELENDIAKEKIDKKTAKKYRHYFNNNAKIDLSILSHLHEELSFYYQLEQQINEIINQNGFFSSFYKEGVFNIDQIKDMFSTIDSFNNNCDYLLQHEKVYSHKEIHLLEESVLSKLTPLHKNLQINFNNILKYIRSIQEFFNKDDVDFAKLPLSLLKRKVDSASKNFSQVNDYLDYYISKRKLERLLPGLTTCLLRYNEINSYISLFLKRFYHDYAMHYINNNTLFLNHTDDSFLLNIEHYLSYDKNRLDVIFALIKNNIKSNMQANKVSLHSLELPYINKLLENNVRILNTRDLIENTINSSKTNFPIWIVSQKDLIALNYNQELPFDLNIVFANDESLTRDVCIYSSNSKQMILVDNKYIQNNEDLEDINLNSNYFVNAAKACMNRINYISSTFKTSRLGINKIDINLKKYLVTLLTNHNFIVNENVDTVLGTIDIVVKLNHSSKPVAIILDHLQYYSIESAIDSLNHSKTVLENLGFIHYRIINSIFFLNEEKEIESLLKTILSSSSNKTTIKTVQVKRPLIEILFPVFEVPELVYSSINKENRKNSEVMLDFLKRTAPILKSKVDEIFLESSQSTLSSLEIEKIITIKNGFVFLNNDIIEFRRIDKYSQEARKLETVSNEELAIGVKKLISYRRFNIDQCIKLLFVSIGLTKMNYNIYFRLENIIKELIEDNQIQEQEKILFIK